MPGLGDRRHGGRLLATASPDAGREPVEERREPELELRVLVPALLEEEREGGRDPRVARDRLRRRATPARPFALRFDHGPEDLRLLHVTRSLSRLGVTAEEYAGLTGGDLRTDFAPAWSALAAEGLVEVVADGVALTPRGMFFADAAAGLLAWPRVLELRRRGLRRASTSPAGDDDALPQFMG